MMQAMTDTRRVADTAYQELIAAYSSVARSYQQVEPPMQPLIAREAAQAAWDLHWHFRRLPWHMSGRALCSDVWCYIATRWEARQDSAHRAAG
jgi:hypothetical protein